MELLFLEPVFKEAIWGGTKLRDSFGYDIPSDTTGECWAISAHKNGDCKIAGGRYDGKYLSQLWEEEPELFGNYPGDQFPLLIKIIDAKNDLSIRYIRTMLTQQNMKMVLSEKPSAGTCWTVSRTPRLSSATMQRIKKNWKR